MSVNTAQGGDRVVASGWREGYVRSTACRVLPDRPPTLTLIGVIVSLQNGIAQRLRRRRGGTGPSPLSRLSVGAGVA